MIDIPPPASGPTDISDLTPVTIFTGFLGSGKTTIISKVIDELSSQGIRVSYIKNEAGEIDLDAKLLGGKHIVAQELLNGCICCTLTGPFLEAMEEIISTYHPDRIVVESSGTAEPANFAITLAGHPKVFRDGVISIVDCLNYELDERVRDIYQIQTKLTDLLVLNKVESVDETRIRKVEQLLRQVNDYSPIIKAKDGIVDLDLLFGINPTRIDEVIEVQEHNHNHADLFAQVITEIAPPSTQELLARLKQLPSEVIRVKGVVQTLEGMRVLNGVYKRFDLFSLPTTVEETTTHLIFFSTKNFSVEDLSAYLR